MQTYISRRQRVKQQKNIRSALFFFILSVSTIAILIIFGVPLVVKYVNFLTDLKRSSTQIDADDHTPPPPPTFEYFPETTNQKSVEIKGYSEPSSTIILFINSQKNEILTDSEGNFSYKLDLNDNQYVIEALARDKSGNESKKVFGGRIVFDDKPPEINISSPADNEQFFGTLNRQVLFSGTTEPDSKLSVNGKNIIVDSNGNFSSRFNLNEGENVFNIICEDKAGNKTEKTIKVFFSY